MKKLKQKQKQKSNEIATESSFIFYILKCLIDFSIIIITLNYMKWDSSTNCNVRSTFYTLIVFLVLNIALFH